MRINPDADLDTSAVTDLRGSSGGGGVGGRVAAGGGGVSIVGLLIYFVLSQLGGGSGGDLGDLMGGLIAQQGSQPSAQSGQDLAAKQEALKRKCSSGAAAPANSDCEAIAIINSIENYWTDQFARSGQRYKHAETNFFNGPVNTGGCGQATPDVGPFYCPADGMAYIDLTFYTELEQKFGAQGGPFARAYVLAHEYGHHVQNLLGTERGVSSRSGPTSGAVRLELQADCYAGAWANHASRTVSASGRPLIEDITQDDVDAALDTAAKIGDDYIQTQLGGGQVNESQFTHGSSAQRQKWFNTGFSTGNPAQCDTFARGVNLG